MSTYRTLAALQTRYSIDTVFTDRDIQKQSDLISAGSHIVEIMMIQFQESRGVKLRADGS